MLILPTINDVVRLVTGQAGSIDVHATWVDSGANISPGRTNTAITTAATTTVVPAPGASTVRNLKLLTVRNKGVAPSDVTVQCYDGTTAFELYKVALGPGQTLQYTDEAGFSIVGAAAFISSNNLVNGKLVESHSANAATFAIKLSDGITDPSPTSPVFCSMPDGSITALTAPTSITIPAGTTFNSITGNPGFRLWFYLMANGALALQECVMNSAAAGLAIVGPGVDRQTTTAISSSANWGVVYSAAAISTPMPYRTIAYVDYDAPLTSGNWAASPARITLAGPGTPRPNTVLQDSVTSVGSGSRVTNNTGSWVGTANINWISLSFLQNAVRIVAATDGYNNAAASAEYTDYMVFRNDVQPIGQQMSQYEWAATAAMANIGFSQSMIDLPFSLATVSYRIFFKIQINGGNTAYCPWFGAMMELQELMG